MTMFAVSRAHCCCHCSFAGLEMQPEYMAHRVPLAELSSRLLPKQLVFSSECSPGQPFSSALPCDASSGASAANQFRCQPQERRGATRAPSLPLVMILSVPSTHVRLFRDGYAMFDVKFEGRSLPFCSLHCHRHFLTCQLRDPSSLRGHFDTFCSRAPQIRRIHPSWCWLQFPLASPTPR